VPFFILHYTTIHLLAQGGTLAHLTALRGLVISVVAAVTAFELWLAGLPQSLQILQIDAQTQLPDGYRKVLVSTLPLPATALPDAATSAPMPMSAETMDARIWDAAAGANRADQPSPLMLSVASDAISHVTVLPSPWPLSASSSIVIHSGFLALRGEQLVPVAGGTDHEQVRSPAPALTQ